MTTGQHTSNFNGEKAGFANLIMVLLNFCKLIACKSCLTMQSNHSDFIGFRFFELEFDGTKFSDWGTIFGLSMYLHIDQGVYSYAILI